MGVGGGEGLLPIEWDFNLLWVRKASGSCELLPRGMHTVGQAEVASGQGVTKQDSQEALTSLLFPFCLEQWPSVVAALGNYLAALRPLPEMLI